MAENLVDIWSEVRGKFRVVVLDLDSNGGELVHTERVITILKGIRGETILETLVRQNHRCLSACVLVYLQGAERTRVVRPFGCSMGRTVCIRMFLRLSRRFGTSTCCDKAAYRSLFCPSSLNRTASTA